MLKLKSVNFEEQQFQNYHLAQSHPEQQEWVIGRNTNCDLVLPNPEVSRVHGHIVYEDNAYYFIDVGSTSGSLLNGAVVPANEKQLLNIGDLLQIGETFLYVEELTSPATASSDDASSIPLVLSDQPWQGDIICRCCRIVNETADVKTFCFIAEPAMLFHYKPGQFVTMELEINGKSVLRSYSISSSPTRPYHLGITIKRVPSPPDQPHLPPGLVSNWLHDNLKVGDRIKLIGGPMGHFTCLPNLPSKMLLISAGSGITPMMSMSRWVQDTLASSDIVFLHSARTPRDIVFRAELEAIATQMSNFRLVVTVTKPPLGHPWMLGDLWMGLTGRISPAMLNLVAPDLFERSVFVCGPNEFMAGVKSMLTDMKFPMQNYQEESFGGKKSSPPKRTSETPTSSIPISKTTAPRNGKGTPSETLPTVATAAATLPGVNFVNSGQKVAADGSMTILDLAEQEGVNIRNACRAGACGACKVLVREGQVRYDGQPQALTPTDQKAGYVLACIAYPVDRVAVEA